MTERYFTLHRVSYLEMETFGVFMDGMLPFAVTLERPWLNNQKSISCIPAGFYTCRRVASPKFGNTFEVTNVPGRSGILFHKGNLSDDTHGCIILGEYFDPLGERNAVLSSGKAFSEFLKRTVNINEFELYIKGEF